jgi:hypothetical protein
VYNDSALQSLLELVVLTEILHDAVELTTEAHIQDAICLIQHKNLTDVALYCCVHSIISAPVE